ncbi:MAG: HAD family hydrolase [Candidatus Bathyarchaeota archaeon]|nr:HAD family hydrolase [Candidatus Bathyarchaeota archaeon]
MGPISAVIFDLDGTLIRSRHNYREMARRAEAILVDEGVPEEELDEPRKVWQIIRGGLEALGGLGLSSERVKWTLQRINEALNSVELLSLDSVESVPGAQEALNLIKARGIRIGIATRAGKPYAERSLEAAGLTKYIDAILARDEVEHPKPDPRHLLQLVGSLGASRESTLYIGDTTTDLTTARAAGIEFVAFAGDGDWVARLREAGCGSFISDIREIVEIIDGTKPT